MTDELIVMMNDQHVGIVIRRGDRLTFEYDDDYRGRTEATPISLSMPLQLKQHDHSKISPWLWGLLPDNEQVLSRWSRRFHVSASSPFSLLSSPVGRDCAGAVAFVPPDEFDDHIARGSDITWLTEAEVAERLVAVRRDSSAWLGDNFSGQFSLAGAQAKIALLFQDGRWGVPYGRTPTNYILKPAIDGLDEHDLNEHICLSAANRLLHSSVESTIGTFGDQTALVVKRYDRTQQGSSLTRHHQEDLCQAMSVTPGMKYQYEGGPSPADIARLFKNVMAPRSATMALHRFTEAMAFNWIVCGTDAHAKNYSLLLNANKTTLAPLYDLASALAYDLDAKKLKLAMKLGGEYRLKNLSKRNWVKFATEIGLDDTRVVGIVETMLENTVPAFESVIRREEISSLGSPLPDALLERLGQRVEEELRSFRISRA